MSKQARPMDDIRTAISIRHLRTWLSLSAVGSLLAAVVVCFWHEGSKELLASCLCVLALAYFLLLKEWIPRIRSWRGVDGAALAMCVLVDVAAACATYTVPRHSAVVVVLKLGFWALVCRSRTLFYVYAAFSIAYQLAIESWTATPLHQPFNYLFLGPALLLFFRICTEQLWQNMLSTRLELNTKLGELDRETQRREEAERQLEVAGSADLISRLSIDRIHASVIIADLSSVMERLDELRAEGRSTSEIEQAILNTDLFDDLVRRIKLSDVNERMLETFGAATRDELEQSLQKTMGPEAIEGRRRFFVNVALHGREYENDVMYRHLKTGGPIWLRTQSRQWRCADTIYAVTTHADITKQVQLRRRLELNEQQLRKTVIELEQERNRRGKIEQELVNAKGGTLISQLTLDVANVAMVILDLTEFVEFVDQQRAQGMVEDELEAQLRDPSLFAEHAAKFHAVEANHELASLIGAESAEDAIDRFSEIFVRESRPVCQEFLVHAASRHEFEGNGVYRNLVTGDRLFFNIQSRLICLDEGTFGIVTVGDVTAENRLKQQLKASEIRKQMALDAGHVGIIELDLDGPVAAVCDYLTYELLGYPAGSLDGPISLIRGLLHPDDYEATVSKTSQVVKGQATAITTRQRMRIHDGRYRWVQIGIKLTESCPEGQPLKAVAAIVDIHDETSAERLIRVERDLLSMNAPLNQVLAFLVRELNREWNPARCAVAMLDVESETAKQIIAGDLEPYLKRLEGKPYDSLLGTCPAAIRIGKQVSDRWRPEALNGSTGEFPEFLTDSCKHMISAPIFWDQTIQATLAVFHVSEPTAMEVGLVQRLTQTVQLIFDRHFQARREAEFEARVLTTDRLESLGRLAGGVAHDFNSLLTVILSHAELIEADCDLAEVRESTGKIAETAKMASGLCRKMLTYAGEVPFESNPECLSDLTEDVCQIVCSGKQRDVEFRTKFDTNLPRVTADRAMISQLILNLVTNALDATPAGGTVTTETGTQELSNRDLEQMTFSDVSRPGKYVYVRVSDTGCGIPPSSVSKVFDPFYTSKVAGTGLGLATVFGVVRRHKGCLHLSTDVDKGTTFTAYFPVVSDAAVQTNKNSRHRIAVIDDEAAIRTTLKRLLERHGYEVITMQSGAEAVERINELGQCDGVLLDQQMAEMDGIETYRRIRQKLRSLPVCFISGYKLTQDISSVVRVDSKCASISKPFRLATVDTTIKRLIGH